jgi:zinc D-Ala-D-Ala carboxypeptidase
VRAALGNKAIHINSWYRCPELNEVVGGVAHSQHVIGEAVDFVCPDFGAPVSICRKLIELKDLIRYDQLIMEGTWVHISFAISTGKPRNQVLSLLRNGSYAQGLTDKQGHQL